MLGLAFKGGFWIQGSLQLCAAKGISLMISFKNNNNMILGNFIEHHYLNISTIHNVIELRINRIESSSFSLLVTDWLIDLFPFDMISLV